MTRIRDNSGNGLVYSTEKGRLCPGCGMTPAQCICCQKSGPPSGDGIVRVGRETKGRKGKGVTTISGVVLPEAGLRELAQKLKKTCGAGGAVKNGVIELQGEHRDQVAKELQKSGWNVKRAGG